MKKSITITILVLGAAGFFYIQNSPTKDWNTFINTEKSFSIKYPNDWRVRDDGFGFILLRPPHIKEDYIWAISSFKTNEKSIEELIADIGDQFELNRAEKREAVQIGKLPATKVTVTTSEVPGWQAENIFIETNGMIYQLSNGAVPDEKFETFYKSFNLLN